MNYSEQTKKIKEAREKFEDKFKEPDNINFFGTFSDLMWQILINETTKGRKVAFTPVVWGYGNELVMADEEGGYFKTSVIFKEANINKCYDICYGLSLEVFGHSEEQAVEIVGKSLSRKS